jgi:hypothetical protein
MIPQQTITLIANNLLGKSLMGQVRWRPDMQEDTGAVVRLSSSRIRIYRLDETDTAEPRIVLSIENANGRVVGEWSASPGQPGWDVLNQLHQSALEISSDWDKVLEEVQSAVQGTEVIGRV